MTYTLIGSGNMAWLIAARMTAGGHTCTGLWSRNTDAADALCAAFSLPRLQSIRDVHDGPDACIVAVSDAAIAGVVAMFAFRTTVLLHTAGSVPLDVLRPHSADAGVVWPVYSVRKSALPAHRAFTTVVAGATPKAVSVARAVAGAISDAIYETDDASRSWLHLGAVMSGNFINFLLGMITDLCIEHQVPPAVLQPMMEQVLADARNTHPAQAQTGPARRHDEGTMNRHLSMLEAHPDWQILYRTLSQAIMNRYPLPRID